MVEIADLYEVESILHKFLFFFQAEDGIRDIGVTGVQTSALPIYKTFTGSIAGRSLSGTWTYDESQQKITLKTLLFSIPLYATRTTSGMSFTMESKKLLTALQTVGKLTGNNTIATISELSKNYEGVRIGFGMKR